MLKSESRNSASSSTDWVPEEVEAAVAKNEAYDLLVEELNVVKAKLALAEEELQNPKPVLVVHRHLPDERRALTRKFKLGDMKIYMVVGYYEDGKIGEITFRGEKFGSLASAMLDALADAISKGLQHGVPLSIYTKHLRGMKFQPAGFTGDPTYPSVGSIFDYIARWLEQNHGEIDVAPR